MIPPTATRLDIRKHETVVACELDARRIAYMSALECRLRVARVRDAQTLVIVGRRAAAVGHGGGALSALGTGGDRQQPDDGGDHEEQGEGRMPRVQ